jgi:hypothetical protein
MLLGKLHIALLKLLLSDAEKGKMDNFVPLSSKDSRFLSFLNFVSLCSQFLMNHLVKLMFFF